MHILGVLRAPKPIFETSSEWLLLEINAYTCVRLKPTQHTEVCIPVQMDLPKPLFHFFMLVELWPKPIMITLVSYIRFSNIYNFNIKHLL